jgi:hypothetical protein
LLLQGIDEVGRGLSERGVDLASLENRLQPINGVRQITVHVCLVLESTCSRCADRIGPRGSPGAMRAAVSAKRN